MWRAFFLAVGVSLLILGAEFLGVERIVLKSRTPPAARTATVDGEAKPSALQEVIPPPWAPWSLMSSGAIVCLYSFTIPMRMKG